jgi:hypothetical protein
MELIKNPSPQRSISVDVGHLAMNLTYKTFDADLQPFAALKILTWVTDGESSITGRLGSHS